MYHPGKKDGPVEIRITHRRIGGWNRYEAAVQKELQRKLNHLLTECDVGLATFKEIKLFLEFSDRNSKRKIGPIRADRYVVSAKVELDWRDKINSDAEGMELFIGQSACSLILGIIAASKCDSSAFFSALSNLALSANLVQQLTQAEQSQQEPEVLDAKSYMTDNLFWDLIEQAKANCMNSGDVAQHAKVLTNRLLELNPGEILDFQIIQKRQLARAYTWELWAVAYMACQGCSDDAFEDFRAWMLTLGRDNFERSIQNPQFLVDLLCPLLPSCIDSIWNGERLLLAATAAYEQQTDWSLTDILGFEDSSIMDQPMGRAWDQEKICEEFPRWCAQFAHEH